MKMIKTSLFALMILTLVSCGEAPKMKADLKFKVDEKSETQSPEFKNAHYWGSDMKWGAVEMHFTNIEGDYHDQSTALGEGIFRVTIRIQGEGTTLEPGDYPAATNLFQEGICSQIFITTSDVQKPKYNAKGATGKVTIESIDGTSIKGKVDITDGNGAQLKGDFVAIGEDV